MTNIAYVNAFMGNKQNAQQQYPIDYIFVSQEFKVKRFGVLSDSLNGRSPSDHYSGLIEVEFKSIDLPN